jgi:short-subunit dehydrogenase
LFPDTPIERILKNIECNALSAVKITHHFVGKMIAAKIKGCVTFTASSSCYIPAPTTAMYVSTKMFLTNFATSLGPELARMISSTNTM